MALAHLVALALREGAGLGLEAEVVGDLAEAVRAAQVVEDDLPVIGKQQAQAAVAFAVAGAGYGRAPPPL